jgi:hypothetical protein
MKRGCTSLNYLVASMIGLDWSTVAEVSRIDIFLEITMCCFNGRYYGRPGTPRRFGRDQMEASWSDLRQCRDWMGDNISRCELWLC